MIMNHFTILMTFCYVNNIKLIIILVIKFDFICFRHQFLKFLCFASIIQLQIQEYSPIRIFLNLNTSSICLFKILLMIYVLRYFYMKTVLSHLSPLYSNLIGLEPVPGSPSLVILSAAERRGTPVLLSATVSDNFGNSPQVAAPRRPREIDQSTQRSQKLTNTRAQLHQAEVRGD